MLTVNADDLGRSRRATDEALRCFGAGRVHSASLMVFMGDSVRAADAALARDLPLALHLNFSEDFEGGAPDRLRRALRRTKAFLTCHRLAPVLWHPLLRGEFASLVGGQLAEFARLTGAPPRRIDGHQHLHLATNVIAGRLLPVGVQVRRNFTTLGRQRPWLNRTYRAGLDRRLSRRHPLTGAFFSLEEATSARSTPALDLARRTDVELMCHPERPGDVDILLSPDWAARLSDVPTGPPRH